MFDNIEPTVGTPGTPQEVVEPLPVNGSAVALKAVAHLLDGSVVKGELRQQRPTNLSGTLDGLSADSPSEFVLYDERGSVLENFRLEELKAVFLVDSLEGNQKRHPVRFYSHGPEVSGLWVEIRFKDGEIMEGLVFNSIHHLNSPGFLLTPTDPGSNNRAAYINKSAITSFRVLGLRPVT